MARDQLIWAVSAHSGAISTTARRTWPSLAGSRLTFGLCLATSGSIWTGLWRPWASSSRSSAIFPNSTDSGAILTNLCGCGQLGIDVCQLLTSLASACAIWKICATATGTCRPHRPGFVFACHARHLRNFQALGLPKFLETPDFRGRRGPDVSYSRFAFSYGNDVRNRVHS